MARTNAQSNALKPKADRIAERIASQKQKMERAVQSTEMEPAESIPTGAYENDGHVEPDVPLKNKGGRPRNETEKTRLVVYLDADIAKAVKLCALEHNATYSDVANAVLTHFLQELEPSMLKK